MKMSINIRSLVKELLENESLLVNYNELDNGGFDLSVRINEEALKGAEVKTEKKFYKKYYVVYRIAYLTDDGRNEYNVPIMVIEDEDICKDFCEKHCYKYYEEVIENDK